MRTLPVKNRLSALLLAASALLLILACGSLSARSTAVAPTATPSGPSDPPPATTSPTPRPLPTLARATPTPLTAATPPTEGADQSQQFIVTEQDLEDSVNSDEMQEQVQTENFDATFTGGKVILTVDSLRYGILNMGSLRVVGTVTATDGVAHFNTESVEPNNLLTAAIPGLLERVLTGSTAGYYVEDVEVQEGRIVYTVRPL